MGRKVWCPLGAMPLPSSSVKVERTSAETDREKEKQIEREKEEKIDKERRKKRRRGWIVEQIMRGVK